MASDKDIVRGAISLDTGGDGIAASHPLTIKFHHATAPSTPGDKTHNTIKEMLIVVGCVSLPESHFAFDSSFLLPESRISFIRLAQMRNQLAEPRGPEGTPDQEKPPLSIFGHADPTGYDGYNIALSQRRAKSVYAVLIRDTAYWKSRMGTGPGGGQGDIWGQAEIAEMERGIIEAGGVPPTDKAGLIEAYMDAICVRKTADGFEPYRLDKSIDFLARGAGSHGKGDLQGCGECNPTLILSKAKSDEFAKDKETGKERRDKANEINRRVIAFLFKPGSIVDPAKWPCPSIANTNALGVCKSRFWADGNARIKQDPIRDKKFGKFRPENEDDVPHIYDPEDEPPPLVTPTFGCRFYHGIAHRSPCEGVKERWVLRMLKRQPLAKKPDLPFIDTYFRVIMGDAEDAPIIEGRTDEDGVVRLPVFDEHTTMKFQIEAGEFGKIGGGSAENEDPDQKDTVRFFTFMLNAGNLQVKTEKLHMSGTRDTQTLKTAVRQRLHSLGYGKDVGEPENDQSLAKMVRRFRRHHDLPDIATIDDEMLAKLREVHDSLPEGSGGEDPPTSAPA